MKPEKNCLECKYVNKRNVNFTSHKNEVVIGFGYTCKKDMSLERHYKDAKKCKQYVFDITK